MEKKDIVSYLQRKCQNLMFCCKNKKQECRKQDCLEEACAVKCWVYIL